MRRSPRQADSRDGDAKEQPHDGFAEKAVEIALPTMFEARPTATTASVMVRT